MDFDECWIPELIPCSNLAEWENYENSLYKIFIEDWVDSQPHFQQKPVYIRRDPKYEGREEGFWHLTCQDYSKKHNGIESRDPDLKRCERINWSRSFIENYPACTSCLDKQNSSCSGVLTWKALSGNKKCRYKFFHEEERYLVVLEERENYFLLITAYFVENEWSFKSILREYNKSSKT